MTASTATEHPPADEDSSEDAKPSQQPDVSTDRVAPSTDAPPEGTPDRAKSAPLGIQQIEDLEDDAKGG